jgi:hypothetical protein
MDSRLRLSAVVLLLGACTAGGTARPSPSTGSLPHAATPTPTPSSASPAESVRDRNACGALDCRLYATPQAAFAAVLAAKPLVLGVGESHAQQGTESVASSTKRFTEDFLPLLRGHASDLVVEVWAPDPKCRKEVQEVAEKQKPVTQSQAKTAKNEFVELAEQAKKLGIVPWPLRPTCDEYDRIARAGEGAVEEMLELVAIVTSRTIKSRLDANRAQGIERMVVAYGGAMHNDVAPRPGNEPRSYGPKLAELTQGRYTELDMFVPEFIKDTDAWRAMPWFAHFDRAQKHDRTTLFRPLPESFVLIFANGGEHAAP